MVALSQVQSSNALIASKLPAGLVAVFVGATSGIGETTLIQFAKHARQPRTYFVGRSQEAGDRIAAECKSVNADGEFVFIKADTSLIRTVDDICRDIKAKETVINLLVLSTGILGGRADTSESIPLGTSLIHYSRARFITNLLPLLQNAPSLRRVVTIFAATKEGPLSTSDLPARHVPLLSARGHAASLVTLSLEAFAKQAPSVSFIHTFPGPVRSNIARSGQGVAVLILKAVFKVIGPFVYIPTVESGDRHLFLATSARYPSALGGEADGVPVEAGEIARGSNGETGSGVYSLDSSCESAGPKVEALLAGFRKEGLVEMVWEHTEGEYRRILGNAVVAKI